MRKFIFNFCLLFSLFSFVQAQTLEQKIYIDFGAPTITTDSPDVNGNYWNNATDGTLTAAPLELLNSEDESTGFILSITKKFSVNPNGDGALKDPDPELLGDFAIATATGDYFYIEGSDGLNGAVRISNLDPAKGYKFNIFGSRTNPGIRTAAYTLIGYNTVSGIHQTTGSDLGGEGIDQNISTIFISDYVFPNANGDIMLEVSRYAGSIAHINAMKIEEYSDVSPEPEPEVKQSIYIDLGAPTITTDSPDANGNYWNNATDGTLNAVPLTLVNSKDETTNFILTVSKPFSVNPNGDGALKEPNPELLGDFAVANATGDYFYVEGNTNGIGELTFKNLNPLNGYRFHVFGSRSNAEERTAVYTFYGLNTFAGIHHTTGTNLGGEGVNQNNRDIFKSDMIFPDSNGEIIFEVTRHVGSIGHVNIIKIEEYTDGDWNLATGISISGEDITVSGATTQFTYELEPATAIDPGINWSVDNESIAWIDKNGVVYPVSNGEVTVTASINYGEASISDSKKIAVSNQNSTLYFVGSASERGEGLENAIPMNKLTDLQGSVTNKFEVYTFLKEEGEFHFYTSLNSEEAVIYGQADAEGNLIADGNAIRVSNVGPAHITVDLNNHTYTVLAIEDITIVGSILGGWSLEAGRSLEYKEDGIWENEFEFTTTPNRDDPHRFVFCINNSWTTLKRIIGTDKIAMESVASDYGFADQLQDIYLRNGKFRITLDLRNNVYEIECLENCDHVIAMMGSSVANGEGATGNQGYAYLYSQLLNDRSESEDGYPWFMWNISVNGNHTTNLLDRFERDLVSSFANYVIYGVSLGNEGVHDNGQTSFDSFRTNMATLIEQARENGVIPIACNNYTRGDFNLQDYEYVKQMNLLMHEWDIPTINMLGAIDNGAGVWASGYQNGTDIYHPNTAGHQEFFYAMVPSLFDALHEGKPQPERVENVSYTLGKKSATDRIELVPEHTIHSYTLSFDIKTSATGVIATGVSEDGTGVIELTANGIQYTSPTGEKIEYATTLTDNQWHKVTLTHYYAWGKTLLYTDATKAGELDEKVVFNTFYLSDENAPDEIEYSQLHFYRSAMNAEEVAALNEGRMLKSSLEIYAPLDGSSEDVLVNLAQSNNTLALDDITGNSISEVEINEYPKTVNVYSVDGRRVATIEMQAADILPEGLKSGFYIIDNEKVFVK